MFLHSLGRLRTLTYLGINLPQRVISGRLWQVATTSASHLQAEVSTGNVGEWVLYFSSSQDVYTDEMWTRYLDKRNCQALLPPTDGLPAFERLEECLKGLNEQPGPYQGFFDGLIKHNKKTAKLPYGSKRYLPAAIDIALGLDFETRVVRTKAYERLGNDPVRLHLIFENTPNISWKVILPLQPLLKKWGDANKGYQGYIHTICHGMPKLASMDGFLNRQSTDKDDYYYVGITGRNVLLLVRVLRSFTAQLFTKMVEHW